MPKLDLAQSFTDLAGDFDAINRHSDPEPHHVRAKVCARELQGGRLIQAAADAEAFKGESWWRGNRCPLTAFEGPDGRPFIRYDSAEEGAALLWVFALGSWLYRDYPEHLRHAAPDPFWTHRRKRPGRIPLPVVYLDTKGRPVRQSWTHADDTFETVEASYTDRDWHAVWRERAAIDAAACRLLARIIRDKPHARKLSGGKRGRPRVNEREHRRIIAAWNNGAKYRTYADCARELGDVNPDHVARAVNREAKRRKPG